MKTQRDQFVTAIASTATKAIAGKAVAQIGTITLLRSAHPGWLVGDAAELGCRFVCDHLGMEDATAETASWIAGVGATVGMGTTIGAVGGPVGAAAGGAIGLGVWAVGKIAGELVHCAIAATVSRR